MKKHSFRKLMAFLLAAVMTVTSVPVTAFAAEEPVVLSSQKIDEAYLTEGMFYFGSAGAEIGEADPGTYRLYVKRNGTDLPEASVRVTMLDMTASYGKDYKVSAEGANIFTGGVKNKKAASSIKEYMEENGDLVTEYNYSDAIIDGTITAENQMSEEEIENPEVSEEEKAELQQAVDQMAEFLLCGEVSEITAEVATASEAAKPETGAAEASTAAEATATPSSFASLAEAKEYATGLKNDRQEMVMAAGSSPLSIIDDLSSQSVGYMDNSLAAVADSLSSAYVILTFKEGEAEKYIDIRTIDNKAGEGDKQSGFNLSAENGELISGVYGNFTLKIIDDEEYEPAVVEFSDETYYPEDGYITVTVKRSVNTNSLASVMLDTRDDTALNTRDYSKVHAKVIFGFGIMERTVKIPVVSAHLTKDASFKLLLQQPVDCVVGERAEAEGIIRTTDASFQPKVTEAAEVSDESLLSSAETTDAALLSDSINRSSVIVADKSEDLPNRVYYQGTNEDDCYTCSYNGGWRLYAESSWYDNVRSWAYFSLPGIHYDYSGLQVVWDRQSGSPNYGSTEFSYYDRESGSWQDLYNDSKNMRERWGSYGSPWTEDYFFRHGSKQSYEYGFEVVRDGGWCGTSPTLTIHAVKPIYRPFEIRLAGAAPVNFIAPDGTIKPNTAIPEMESENIVRLENANDNVLVTNTKGKDGRGNFITVSLDGGAKNTYIYGLEIVSWDGSRSRTILSGQGESTRSISLEITNSLISSNASYIDFCDNGNYGDYGRFQVRAILRPKEATLRVKNNDIATVTLEGGNGTIKKGSVSGEYTVYNFHMGDTAIYHVAMKDKFVRSYTWDQINVTGENPRTNPIGLLRVGNTDTVKGRLVSARTIADPQYTKKNNKLTVRVKKEDVGKFENTGIFSAEYEICGDYYEYIVDREKSENDAHISGTRYLLSATPKDKNLTPVWSELFVSSVKYMQRDFCFDGTGDIDSNTLLLTAERPDATYVLSGVACYDDVSLDGYASSDHWYRAAGVSMVVDRTHYGISDNDGKIETMAFPGKEGYCVRYRIYADGNEILRTAKLVRSATLRKTDPVTKETIYYCKNDVELIEVPPFASDRVHFNTVTAMQRVGDYVKKISINSDFTALTASLQLTDPATGKSYVYTYTDENGKTQTAVEHVTDVLFVVVDPVTRKEKTKFAAKQDETDPTRWVYTGAFETGHYGQYQSGDMLYVKMLTDRIVGRLEKTDNEDVGKRVCEYALINTGITFTEPAPEPPMIVDIEFPVYEFYELPVIGDLSTILNALGLSFGVTQTEEGVRVYFGKQISPKGTHFDGNGNATSDTGFDYGIKDVADPGKIFSDFKDMTDTFGSQNKLGAMSIGIPAWSIEPMAGVYFEFCVYVDGSGRFRNRYLFTGGGGYLGVIGTFRYTYYMLICGVPVYVGGDISLTLVGEFGVAVDAGKEIFYDEPDQGFFDNLIKNSHFEFIFRAILDANAYAGVGVCGTLGVRGGFNLNIAFIYNPTIRRSYPEMREVGFAVTGSIKFWIDAILLTIPIPVYTWDDWCKMGYFEDLDRMEKEREQRRHEQQYGNANLLSSVSDAVIAKKSRSAEASEFMGDVPAENAETTLLGADPQSDSLHVFSDLKEQTILKNGFDDPQQKLLNFTSGGKEKILMAYLDDNAERIDDERTELRVSIYDVSDGTWSEPEVVQADGTADFSPAICDAGDRIFLTWVSRKEKLGETASYADYLKSLDIFFAEFDKETLQLSEPEQLTEDSYYDTTPHVVYDQKTKQAIVTYYKSEVPTIRTPDDLLKAAAPEMNHSELVYMLYENGKWVRNTIYPGELAEGVDPAPLLGALNGQRFVNSALLGAGMNNPAIGDATAATVGMYTYSREEIEKARQSAAEKKEAEREAIRKELEEAIRASVKNTAVLCYSVDMDQNLSTESDREIFVQTYDFENHTAGTPIRITDDTVNDSQPQIAESGDRSFLFWLSDGKELRYIDLTELLINSEDGSYTGEPSTAGVKMNPGGMFDPLIGTEAEPVDGASINNFRVFSQRTENGSDLFVAWQERFDEERSDEAQKGDFSQDIYVSALIIKNGAGAAGEINGGSWSDGIRMTANGKVNEIPEFASLGGDTVMMVENRFCMTGGEDGTPYETSDVELVSMMYEPQAQMDLRSVTVDTYPEKVGDAFTMTLGFRNTGLTAAEGFWYLGYMKDADGMAAPGSTISGEVNETVPAGSMAYVTVNTVLGDEKGTLYLMTSPKGSQVCSYDEFCVFEDADISLSDVKAVQEGNEFRITGLITNRSLHTTGPEKIRIYDTLGAKTLDASFAVPAVEPGMIGPFEVRVPADPELSRYGYQDMVAVLVGENGGRVSNYENIRAYLQSALNIRVNDVADGGELVVAKDGKLSLAVTYTPDLYYRNGSGLFTTEDPEVATVVDGKLLGVSEGITKLHVTIDPFGGESTYDVTVKEGSFEPYVSSGISGTNVPVGPKDAARMTGRWQQQADGSWKFLNSNGSAFSGWGYISTVNGWDYYHMKADGTMDYGWFYDEAAKEWYYLNENHDGRFGAMTRGWHLDARDGKWYYLDPKDGHMAVGWILDKGKWYYLSGGSGTPVWIQNEKGEWVYGGTGRAAGSMYANEKTPDGYTVDATGAWIP